MTIHVDEKTELQIPLKLLITVLVFFLSASWYVFKTQERIHILETELKMLVQSFESYKKQPSRNTTEVELIKRDIEYLKQHKH